MPKLSGNKGEWSEAYVLLRLLAQGRIYAANENLEQIDDMYFPILKILREEMEKAAKLSVPLKVDMKVGRSWYDTK
mgnify:CR=1 FL=1